MTAFMDYYMVRVEKFLERNATQNEISLAKELYIIGWHPARTAQYLKQEPDKREIYNKREIL